MVDKRIALCQGCQHANGRREKVLNRAIRERESDREKIGLNDARDKSAEIFSHRPC